MHLRNGCDTLRERCVTGITANRERMAQAVRESIGLVTALNPYIGYSAASEVARDALATGRPYTIWFSQKNSSRRSSSTRSCGRKS